MFGSRVERRLRSVAARAARLRAELELLDHEREHFGDEAEQARVRSLVADSPAADHEGRAAARQTDALAGRRQEILSALARLDDEQDRLLDRLNSERRGS